MTVKKDLEKAIAAAESAKGTYATFSQSTDDQTAKAMFEQMSQDMENHISQLESRLGATTNQTSGTSGSYVTTSSTTNNSDNNLQ